MNSAHEYSELIDIATGETYPDTEFLTGENESEPEPDRVELALAYATLYGERASLEAELKLFKVEIAKKQEDMLQQIYNKRKQERKLLRQLAKLS